MEVLIQIPDCKPGCKHAECSYADVIGALEDTKERTRRGFSVLEVGDDRERVGDTEVQTEQLYYIQKKGFVGNCLLWWRPNGNGYTTNLDAAWKVPREKALEICRVRPPEDIAWRVEDVDKVALRHASHKIPSRPLKASRRRPAKQT